MLASNCISFKVKILPVHGKQRWFPEHLLSHCGSCRSPNNLTPCSLHNHLALLQQWARPTWERLSFAQSPICRHQPQQRRQICFRSERRADAVTPLLLARLLMHWQSAPGLKSAATSRIEKPAACFRFAPTAELAHTSFHERPEQVPHLREPATRPEHATSVIEVHQESGVRRSALCSCRKVQQSHRETPQEVMANVNHHQVRTGASRKSS